MPASAPTVALVTIGQAPRHDLSEAIEARLPAGATTLHAGVLDGLSATEAAAQYGADESDEQLITRLSDGSVVVLAASAVEGGLQRTIDAAEDAGAGIVVILCTGEFPSLRTRSAWLIEPDAVVPATATSLLRHERVGIIVPMTDQIPAASRKWHGLREPRFATASPYAPDDAELIAAGQDLIDQGATAIVLDCMGYGSRHREALQASGLTVPVLVSGGVVAAALSAAL